MKIEDNVITGRWKRTEKSRKVEMKRRRGREEEDNEKGIFGSWIGELEFSLTLLCRR